jgi:hypothetical protein
VISLHGEIKKILCPSSCLILQHPPNVAAFILKQKEPSDFSLSVIPSQHESAAPVKARHVAPFALEAGCLNRNSVLYISKCAFQIHGTCN